MRFGNFELRFSPIPWLAALVLFALLAKLGFWQLNRADEKRQILAAQAAAAEMPSLPLAALEGNDLHDWRYRRITVEGEMDLSRQFLLDNQVVNKHVGFNVITPLESDNLDALLLIDRGFVPIDNRREKLPSIENKCDANHFTGTIYVPTSGYRLGGMDEAGSTGWPRIIQFFDFNEIENRLGRKVTPAILRMDPGDNCGYERTWEWVSSQPVRHVGYAVQWFAMAATVLILLMVLSIRKR